MKKLYAWFMLMLLFLSMVIGFFPIHNVKAATTYYISTTGNDSTGTGTFVNPWRTIQKGVDNVVAGDTISIRGGTYNEAIVITTSGSAGSPITMTGYNGEWVYVNGSGVSTDPGEGMINITDAKYLTFTDFVICYPPEDGIATSRTRSTTPSNNITIHNVTFEHIEGGRAVNFWSYRCDVLAYHIADVDINNCTFHYLGNTSHSEYSYETITWKCLRDSTFHYNICTDFIKQPGMEVYNCQNVSIHHNYMEGSNINPNVQLFYVHGMIGTGFGGVNHGISANYTVANNTFIGYCSTFKLGSETNEVGQEHRDHVIENNIIWSNYTRPFTWWNLNNYANYSRIIIRYNTIVSTAPSYSTAYPMYIQTRINNNAVHDCVVANNIFYYTGITKYAVQADAFDNNPEDSDLIFRNNLFYNASGTTKTYWKDTAGYMGVDYITDSNPDFVSLGTDFSLQSVSPCIDAGNSTYPSSVDIDGNTRPQGAGYDIGAYEYPGASFTFSSTSPTNGSTGVSLTPTIQTSITESHGYQFNYTIQENTTGSWKTQTSENNVNNKTVSTTYTNASVNNHKYWWRVCALNGSVWHNETFHFTTVTGGSPSVHNPHDIHANWTTSTSLNITFTKGVGSANTYIRRKTGSYPISLSDGTQVYAGGLTYYNDTSLSPATRYFYRMWGEDIGIFSDGINVSMVETDNATSYGASWLEFTGYLTTDLSVNARYEYSTDAGFTTTNTNVTALDTSNTAYTSYMDGVVYGDVWNGQSFMTSSSPYYLYNITIRARRSGSPGYLYCYLYATGADWLPTGSILSSGSTNANEFTTNNQGLWYNITMTPYNLSANTRYAFVLSAGNGTALNFMVWSDNRTNNYADGCGFYSDDGGSTYNNYTVYVSDFRFKIWTKTPVVYGHYLMTTNSTLSSSQSYDITQDSLEPGSLYYYRGAANDSNGNFTHGNIRYSLTKPEVPTFLSLTPSFSNNSLYISWINGTGANRTVIVNGGTSFPSVPGDGTVLYNGTDTDTWLHNISFNTSYKISLFSFTTWAGLSRFSSGAATVPFGGISFICYNESSGLPIGYDVLVSNTVGDNVYYGPNLYGYTFINTSEIPLGQRIAFHVSNNSGMYNSRIYYYDLTTDIFFNLSFYLPVRSFPPPENVSYLYKLDVYEVIESEQYSYSLPVEDVLMTIKRYINATGGFETVGAYVTDSSGRVSVPLIPDRWYKIYLNKTGYYNVTGNDYFPDPPNEWGQTDVKLFRIERIYGTSEEEVERMFWDYCTFNGTIYGNNTINVQFVDTLGNVTNATFLIYEEYNASETLVDSNDTTSSTYDYWFSISNYSRVHKIVLHLNQTNFGWINITLMINPWVNQTELNERRVWIEDTSSDVFGSFDLGYVNFFVIFGSCLAILLIPGNKSLEFGIVGVGLVLGLLSTKISLSPVFLALIPFIVFIGIVYAMVKHGKVKI